MVRKYSHKRVEVEAFQWTGGLDQTEDPPWIVEALKTGRAWITKDSAGEVNLYIPIPGGIIIADSGDYIIRDDKGKLCSCKPGIFEATYELI